MRRALFGFVVLFAAALICAAVLSRPHVRDVTLAMLTAFIMLSMVPLTGWANQISLAQITLAGCGAFAMVEWGHSGNVLDLLIAAGFAVPVGLLMAGPAVRLQGLYLALATMAFAWMAEFLFFSQPTVFGATDRLVPRLSLFGVQLSDPFTFLGIDVPRGRRLPPVRGRPVRRRRHARRVVAATGVRTPADRDARQSLGVRHGRRQPDVDEAPRVRVLGSDRRSRRRAVRRLLRQHRHRRTSS